MVFCHFDDETCPQSDCSCTVNICLMHVLDCVSGEWKEGKRHGHGTCHFADGTKFTGEWEDDAWLQSAAESSLCVATGDGLSHAAAGEEAEFVIQVSLFTKAFLKLWPCMKTGPCPCGAIVDI